MEALHGGTTWTAMLSTGSNQNNTVAIRRERVNICRRAKPSSIVDYINPLDTPLCKDNRINTSKF